MAKHLSHKHCEVCTDIHVALLDGPQRVRKEMVVFNEKRKTRYLASKVLEFSQENYFFIQKQDLVSRSVIFRSNQNQDN